MRMPMAATLLFLIYAACSYAGEAGPIMEHFDTLDRWQPFRFPKIRKHSEYSIARDPQGNYLQARSAGGASALRYDETFDVYATPILSWRWKAMNVYRNGDATRKSGDDYPIRIYVMFRYDPERASLGKRARYALAKALYGEELPDSGLNYIWSSKRHLGRYITSPYTDESMMIPMDSGTERLGQWVEHETNILEDYRAAFGKEPPREASLAVMSDSDNTGESATAFIDYIILRSNGR